MADGETHTLLGHIVVANLLQTQPWSLSWTLKLCWYQQTQEHPVLSSGLQACCPLSPSGPVSRAINILLTGLCCTSTQTN